MTGARPHARSLAHAAACAVVLAAAGCSAAGQDDAAPSASPSGTGAAAAAPRGPDGAPGCRPESPVAPYDGIAEVRATGHGIRASGLIMAPGGYPPLRASRELKIVWRVTGSGPLRATTTGPGGRDHPVLWGPEEHGGSTYRRPGDEWGVGYKLDEPGCWRLRLIRGAASADAWLRVAA
ncbi:hypothetical protein [Spirillospora sp. NPDC048819]|uniref:hypothetical protein n=1 Tax=Spirillospora sp. NPDC048819 TaxID=3155268 RepID=UPI00340CC647